MGGKTKTTTKSSQSNAAYEPYKPVIDQGANISQSYLNNPNSTAVFEGPRIAEMSADTQAGIGQLRDSQGATTSRDFLTGLLGQGAGENNPAIAAMQDKLRRQVQAQVNAQFSSAGTVGGSQHQGTIAQGFADALAQPLFSAYENDSNRQLQAAGMLPGVDQGIINNRLGAGEIQDSYNQNRINSDREEFEDRRTAPIRAWNEVAPWASQIGSQFGTQNGTQTQTTKTPLSQQVLGGALALGGLASGVGGLGAVGGMIGKMGTTASPWSWSRPQLASNSTFDLNKIYGGY